MAASIPGLLAAILLAAAPDGGGEPPRPPGPAAPGAERLELAAGGELVGSVAGIEPGKLVFRTASGEQRVGLPELARLVRAPAGECRRRTDGVVLTGGDVLEGQAVDLGREGLRLESPRFGRLNVLAAGVRALFFDQELAGAGRECASPGEDAVLMVTGSRTPAELRWLDEERVGLASPLGALDVEKEDVAWVYRKTPAPPAAPRGALRVLLSGGERLTGELLGLADGKLRLRWEGRELELAWDLVRALESPGERMAYLADLPLTAGEPTAALGPVRAPRVDRAADGGPLSLGGRSWSRGVGMRATSRAKFRLDGRWKRLRALVGPDSRAGRASRGILFRVLGDGREIFSRKMLPGDGPAGVDLAVDGVRELTLVLEAGPGFEIGDYGDWVDARVLR